MLTHSVDSAEEGCIQIYSVEDVTQISTFLSTTFYRHYNSYKYAYTTTQPEETVHHDLIVETPLPPPPLCEGQLFGEAVPEPCVEAPAPAPAPYYEEDHVEYYGEVVFNLSPAQRADRRRYHTATQDLRYDRLNPELTKLYLSGGVKKKKDGKHYGFEHVRKYHDAILYCSKLAKQDLPRNYLTQMKQYIHP